MNILLININPLVSRLLLLCTRDKHMILEEVEKVKAVQRDGYDIVFVDDASYESEVENLFAMLEVRKKVFLSADEEMNDFDVTILKPFLPSQITEVLESIDEVSDRHKSREILSIFPLSAEKNNPEKNNLMQKDEQQQAESIEERKETATKVLDSKEIEKIKALLEMQSDEPPEQEVFLSDEEYASRKVELIKEQLIAEGLEIVDEEEMIDEISSFKSILSSTVEKESKKKRSREKDKRKVKKRKKEKKKKKSELTKKEFSRIKDAITGIITNMKEKKMKKLLKGKKIGFDIKLKDNK